MYSKFPVVATKPYFSTVTIALLLHSGERLIAEFRPEGDP